MNQQRGFSLIDVSVLVAILGLLAASLLSSQSVKKESTGLAVTEQRLDVADAAIRQFFRENGRLPCPASLTVRIGTDPFGGQILYGREPTGTFACGGATAPTMVTHGIQEHRKSPPSRYIRIGALPTRDLGLPDRAGIDGWNNRIWYVVIEELATSPAAVAAFVLPASPHEPISLLSSLTPNVEVEKFAPGDALAYVLISMGKDQLGAYSKEGAPRVPCDLTNPRSIESENCDSGDVYTYTPITDNLDVNDANYFYDLLRWGRLKEFRD